MSGKCRREKKIFGGNEMIEEFAAHDENKIFPKCLQLIANIIKNEGENDQSIFTHEKAINLDKAEFLGKNTENDCTVDFVIALKSRELLLVDAKYKVTNPANLFHDLEKKIAHSADLLLSCDNSFHISHEIALLFSCNNYETIRRQLRRRSNEGRPGILKKFSITPYTTIGFYSEYFVAS